MAVVTRGFRGRREPAAALPPGQYLTRDFPVLSAGPTQKVRLDGWELTVGVAGGTQRSWTWPQFLALPSEQFTVDIHCVTKWSKLDTRWHGVSLDVLLDGLDPAPPYALVDCYGGYTTNLPAADLRGGRAWIAFRYGDADLAPEHGGPARLLVPHLYLWKSAKWVRRIQLAETDQPGFWESLGYHNYGDPWQEQRYWSD
jgi:DMSO/TMAO reductase YedYZ molybdopterin-dependent catalytic subunit